MSQSLLSNNNHLFKLARQRSLRWPKRFQRAYPIATLFYAVVAVFLSQIIGLIPIVLYMQATDGDLEALIEGGGNSSEAAVLLISAFLPIFILIWAWLRFVEQRPLWTIGLENYDGLRRYLRGLGVGMAMFSAAIIFMLLLGYVTIEVPAENPSVGFLLFGLVSIFMGWMIQGAAEEVLTRGFLLPIIGIQWGTAAGILLSSLLFAVLHLLNPNVSVIAMLNLFLFGIFAALYAIAEGDLWGVFAIHSVWNFAQGNIFGFEVSGQRIGGLSIFNFTETGPDMLTGGQFGPEGGFIITAVLILSCLWVWWRHQ